MHWARIGILFCAAGLTAFAQESEFNVNERYRIERVEVTGVSQKRISPALRDEIDRLAGQMFVSREIEALEKRLRKEFPNHEVSRKLSRGEQPEHVRITFALSWRHVHAFDVNLDHCLYHSKQGWSCDVETQMRRGNSTFAFGVVSDGDTRLERFAGLKARYENRKVASDRVRLEFLFESYHQIWNGATLGELRRTGSITDLYRTRQNFQPVLTVNLAPGLKLSGGVSFQRFQLQFPAAHTGAANAVIGTLRYDRQVEDWASNRHRVEAGYDLRAATRALESDFVYTRHQGTFRYTLWRGRQQLRVQALGGAISGRAPLFERFSLGDSSTLRGWNKYDLAPLGGHRMEHNSVEYRYRDFLIFHDGGAVWDRGQQAEYKHSAGLGLRCSGLTLAVAFPIRAGRAEPVFLARVDFR